MLPTPEVQTLFILAADLIIMTTPSHARAAVTKQIVPHIDKKKPVFFGVMPGSCLLVRAHLHCARLSTRHGRL
mgnify:CR=1 FL=1